jgi:hypothetical protein
MSLNLIHLFKWVPQNLDASWFCLLLGTSADSTEDSSSVMHQNNLLQANLLFKSKRFFAQMDARLTVPLSELS